MTEREYSLGATWSRVNVRLLEVFACVVEAGTMSSAGERLGISQAAVSQAVASLEAALGVQLFDRSVRPPALTLVGRTASRCAKETLEKLRELEDVVRNASSSRVPLLRLGMINSFTSTAGASVLQQLRDVADEWSVTSGYSATTFESLLERRVDVVITSDESAIPASVSAVDLLTERFVVAAPAGWAGTVSDLSSLAAAMDFVRFGRDAHMLSTIESLLHRSGVGRPCRYQFDTTDAVLQMVAAGFGWTIMPPLILLKSGIPLESLRLAAPDGPPISRTLRLAMRAQESAGILQRVRSSALHALRTVVLPRMQPMVAQVPNAFVLAADAVAPRRGARGV